MVDANVELIEQIRIPEDASDQEIQDILRQVFNAQARNVHSDSDQCSLNPFHHS